MWIVKTSWCVWSWHRSEQAADIACIARRRKTGEMCWVEYRPLETTTKFKEARELIRSMGCTLHVQDGEYRVNLYKGTEETAYYTDDLQDAVSTAARMTEQWED